VRIFVTGGSGYIGTHLVQALVNEGHHVTILTRGKSSCEHLDGVTILSGDLSQPGTLEQVQAPLDVDVVYHLVSAFVEPSGIDITVASTENLVQYYSGSPLKQLIYFSNTCVYGDTRGRLPTEDDPPTPNTLHGKNKLRAEKVVQASGLPYTILRGTQFYGSNHPAINSSFDWIVLDPVIRGELPLVAGGRHRVGMVHVEDVVQIALLVLLNERAMHQIFNHCSGDISVTNREVFHLIANEAEAQRPREVPKTVALTFAWVSEKLAAFRGTEPVVVPDMIRVLFSDRVVSIKKAEDMLGYQPKHANTLESLKQEYADTLQQGFSQAESRLGTVRGQLN